MKWCRFKYQNEINHGIIENNTDNLPMVDIDDEHFIATHDVKDLLI